MPLHWWFNVGMRPTGFGLDFWGPFHADFGSRYRQHARFIGAL